MNRSYFWYKALYLSALCILAACDHTDVRVVQTADAVDVKVYTNDSSVGASHGDGASLHLLCNQNPTRWVLVPYTMFVPMPGLTSPRSTQAELP